MRWQTSRAPDAGVVERHRHRAVPLFELLREVHPVRRVVERRILRQREIVRRHGTDGSRLEEVVSTRRAAMRRSAVFVPCSISSSR